MNWLKKFRKTRGLTLTQMAQFAGITRKYLSTLEARSALPPKLRELFLELEQEFEKAHAATDYSTFVSPPHQTEAFRKDLEKRLAKKREQLARLRNHTASLEKRYRCQLLIKEVCIRWRNLKKDTDPLLPVKMETVEADMKIELRKCGPPAQGAVRLRIARLETEINQANEELQFILSVQKKNPAGNPPI